MPGTKAEALEGNQGKGFLTTNLIRDLYSRGILSSSSVKDLCPTPWCILARPQLLVSGYHGQSHAKQARVQWKPDLPPGVDLVWPISFPLLF